MLEQLQKNEIPFAIMTHMLKHREGFRDMEEYGKKVKNDIGIEEHIGHKIYSHKIYGM